MIYIFIFIIGLCVGSFLNVLIDRIPKEESIIKGRSYCDSCRKKLAWYDLIPILSFIFLRGKCRNCHSPISWQYPVVELITGILFVLTTLNFQLSTFNSQLLFFISYLFIVSSLIVIFFADLKYGIIPNKILYPTILIALFFLILNSQFSILNYLLSAGIAFLFFLSIFLLTKGRGMGFGDVKLSFLMGLILGFPKIVVALYIAFLTGAAISLILVLWRKKRLRGGTIPFGPFLVLGTLAAIFGGDIILHYAFSFLLY